MKKILLICSLLIMLLSSGCSKNTNEKIINKFYDNVNNAKSYSLTGELNILNNESVYTYKIYADYKSNDLYKVKLVNTSNNHEQVILKNKDGVYVITPALNKSFKFQSDWPNHSSESYLLQPIVNDLKTNDYSYKENENNHIYTVAANYPNNTKLAVEDIIFDKDGNIKSVIVYDSNNVKQIEMKFENIEYNNNIDDDLFLTDKVISSCNDCDNEKETSVIDDAILPLYIPSGSKLTNQDIINTNNGERVILTYEGEVSFVLVEESSQSYSELEIIPVSGEPYMVTDTYGALNDSSISWTMAGIDYYITSEVLSQQELIEIAKSISVIPTMK